MISTLYNAIKAGKNGANKGIPTGLPKLDSLTYGIQRKWMTVIAGDSGSGKSSLALYYSVYKPFCTYMDTKGTINAIDIKFLLFSFELASDVLLAKLLSTYIFEYYGRVISYSDILSLQNTLSDDDYNLILTAKPWLEEFERICEVIDKPVTAKGLYAICKEWSRKYGDYEETVTPNGYIKETYKPKNPQQFLIVLVDHIKLLTTDSGNTSKQEIDKACDFLIGFRNKCSFTIYIVQQLNRTFKSMARRGNDGLYSLLQLDDLADSSGPGNAAEVVIGIFFPFREKLSKCEGYDIKILRDRMRLVQILKQRFGMSDRSVGCTFFGEVGLWNELPLPNEIQDYTQYVKLI